MAFKDINLVDSTVTYNGVQFGGADAPQRSLPPKFKLSSQVIYDSANRTRMFIRYTLGVAAYFDADSQAAMAANMTAMRAALTQPARKLEIRGLGLALDTIQDVNGGPHPIGEPTLTMLANYAWEVLWAVEFDINPCLSTGNDYQWLAFNYTTNWTRDYEGHSTRSIQGYYQIPHVRNPLTPNAPLPRAETKLAQLVVTIPVGFYRVQGNLTESEDKKRMDFAFVDVQEAGDPLPENIIEADGDVSFSTGGGSADNPLTWAQGTATLSASYRVAPGQPSTVAGSTFLVEAMGLQAAMQAVLPPKASVIPLNFTARNGKYRSARNSSFSISWQLTKCVSDFLSAGGLWRRLGTNTHAQWRTSVEGLWSNRGNMGIHGTATDDIVLDLCLDASAIGQNIGNDVGTLPAGNPVGGLSFACPDVAADAGWIQYDVRVSVVRNDRQTLHTKATPYVPTDTSGDPEEEGGDESVPLGGPSFSMSETTEHNVEYNGLPDTIVVLEWRAMRYRHKPIMPQITTVGGKPAVLIAQSGSAPEPIGELMGCCYYRARGWRVYRVVGYIQSIKPTTNKVGCGECSEREGSDY